MKRSIHRLILAVVTVLIVASPAIAATIKVSSNGMDSGTCGSGGNPPCATLAQAVANATGGDSILVGPGSYSGATIDKALKLWSSNGTGGAVITSPITLSAAGIVFGKLGKGFSLNPGSPNNAIVVTANAVTVRGNVVSDCAIGVDSTGSDTVVRDNSFDSCTTAIQIAGSGAQVRGNRTGYVASNGVLLAPTSTAAVVRENRMFGPSGVAIVIGGSGHLLRRNLVHGTPGAGFSVTGAPAGVHLLENVVVSSSAPAYFLSAGSGWVLTRNAALNNSAPGFYLSAGTTATLTGNVAIGNSVYGIFIALGSDHALEDNTAIDNMGDGIYLASIGTGVAISGGNLYGNTSNCGINNNSGSAVTADKVYWGAASGPGVDPADDVCGNVAVVSVTKPAAKPANIKLPPVR
jgi:hypothetical protein